MEGHVLNAMLPVSITMIDALRKSLGFNDSVTLDILERGKAAFLSLIHSSMDLLRFL